MEPAFITLEGGEGVGKTTQMKLLKERLPNLFPHREFVFTREPGGTPFSDKIRELILSDEGKEADGMTMFGLFAAARAEHIRRIIKPALSEGKTVISDRFVGATYAYQAYAQDNPIPEDLFEAHLLSLRCTPALTLILDVDPNVAQARVHDRQKSQQVLTHFDARPMEFHERLREGYLQFAKRYNTGIHRVILVDAQGSVEEIHAAMAHVLKDLLKEKVE